MTKYFRIILIILAAFIGMRLLGIVMKTAPAIFVLFFTISTIVLLIVVIKGSLKIIRIHNRKTALIAFTVSLLMFFVAINISEQLDTRTPEQKQADKNDWELLKAKNSGQSDLTNDEILAKVEKETRWRFEDVNIVLENDVMIINAKKEELTINSLNMDISSLAKKLYSNIKNMPNCKIIINSTFIDKYGNESLGEAARVYIDKEIAKKINYDNLTSEDVTKLFEVWYHPTMSKSVWN